MHVTRLRMDRCRRARHDGQMVRLRDLSDAEREHIMAKELPSYDSTPFVEGPPLAERRVALVTTAGLHHVDDDAFSFVDLSYRVIPGDADLQLADDDPLVGPLRSQRLPRGREHSLSRLIGFTSSLLTAPSARWPTTTTH